MEITWGGVLEITLRLVLAAFLGGLIGYQRELAERPAGFRTHILVCLGSSLMMIISYYPFLGKPYADPSRIAAGAITGIGFLGAGTIIRQGSVIKGLTTAASIWAIAGVGLAVGSGSYWPALIATLIIFLSLTVLKGVERRIVGAKELFTLNVRIEDTPGQLGRIGSDLGELHVNIRGIEMEAEEEGVALLHLILDIPSSLASEKVLKKVASVEGVKGAEWESKPR